MKLFILRPKEDLVDSPWEPWYDKSFGFVVRAESEENARKIADKEAGDENGWGKDKKNPWLNPKQSTCIELTANGKEELIIRDFNAA